MTFQRPRTTPRAPSRLAAMVAVAALGIGAENALALNMGYYEMCEQSGRANQATPITDAGHTAIDVNDLTPAELAGLDVLFVNNCSNELYDAEYLAHLADIDAAVANGLILVMHDRFVELAETILPGGASMDIRRHVEDNGQREIQVADGGTLLTNGPGGVITDTNLDNGSSSNHGYAVASSLPGDARVILTRDDPTRVVDFAYGYGSGAVLYSTIPLDHYLGQSFNIGPVLNSIYAPNLVAYAAELADPTCGNGVVDAGEDCDLGIGNSGPTCCTFDCALRGAGRTCRPAAGACDAVEACDGSSTACPADVVLAAGTECRAAADVCDLAETCSGTGPACPADAVRPNGDGDALCDLIDNCDTATNPGQEDADGDGAGDACDACSNVVPTVPLKATKIIVSGAATPPGDDKLTIVGDFADVPEFPEVSPDTTGVRVLLEDPTGGIVDATIPPGDFDKVAKIGWKANGTRTSFRYVNQSASPIQGIFGVSIRKTRIPGQLKFTIKGKRSTYPVSPLELPLVATLVLDPPLAEAGQCAETSFSAARCRFNRSGSSVTCK